MKSQSSNTVVDMIFGFNNRWQEIYTFHWLYSNTFTHFG